MPQPPSAARRRPKPGNFSPSVFNRCNACNLLLSVGLIFFVVRLLAYPSSESAADEEPYPEKLDPALIDEVTWPERPSAADCKFVAGYGPGGVNDTRALLLRRGARTWPIVDRISLRSLSWKYPDAWGTVTIAPSNVFTLFTNSTEQQYADAHLSADQVPAKLRNMALRQFAAYQQPSRLRRRLRNMYYTSEHYYYSGQPPPTLGHRPEEPPLSCLTQPSKQPGEEELFITTPRMRLTARDSVHILHYDTSPSLLVQVKGRKLVTLIPSSQMAYTYPYARGHLLYRRSRVELLKPDYEKYPLARKLQPTELVMRAGDILVFPRNTCHQTRVLSEENVSLSFRFKTQVRW